MARLGQFRRDTIANWLNINPIIADGEFILVSTDPNFPQNYNQFKIGNGVDRFNLLPNILDIGVNSGLCNITSLVPLGQDEYYTFETATVAIPSAIRKKGLICTYSTLYEKEILILTSGSTSTGNISITLNGIEKLINITENSTIQDIIDLIKNTYFEGWEVGSLNNTVTFISTTLGDKVAPIFVDSDSTGVTATFLTSTAERWELLQFIGSTFSTWTLANSWKNLISTPAIPVPEIYFVGGIEPTDNNIKIWIDISLPEVVIFKYKDENGEFIELANKSDLNSEAQRAQDAEIQLQTNIDGVEISKWEESTVLNESIKYGRLYNWYAATDQRGIAPAGWHVPSYQECYDLYVYVEHTNSEPYLYAYKMASGKYWNSSDVINSPGYNLNNNDTVEFSIVPTGNYDNNTFNGINQFCNIWINGEVSSELSLTMNMRYNERFQSIIPINKYIGLPIRLIKDNAINEGNIIIDGDTYNTVTIGNQVWLQQNLAVKHYQNGDLIGSDFSGTEGAVTAYDNDESNVYIFYIKPKLNKKIHTSSVEGLEENLISLKRDLLSYEKITNKVTEFSETPTDLAYPSEKLVKDTIDSLDLSKWENPIIPAATTLHPRWDDSHNATIYGTDRFGYGALPSGERFSSGMEQYAVVGSKTTIWTQTNDLQYEYKALTCIFPSDEGVLYLGRANEKSNGYSIRAVRTATSEEQLLPDGLISATYTDYDGNIYKCTKIGYQIWTTSNLKVTHYADGTLIPTNLSDASWAVDTDGACAVYGKNDSAFVPTDELDTESKMVAAYDRLYNWYAVNNAHGLIDTTNGWHVPTDAEFTQLTDYLIATYPEITSDNIGDVLKSVRQINSPYVITDQVHIKPKLDKRIKVDIIDGLENLVLPYEKIINKVTEFGLVPSNLKYPSEKLVKDTFDNLDLSKWEQGTISAATTLHPRWDDSNNATIYGTDRFGFGALPSGYRQNYGAFLSIGVTLNIHTSSFFDHPVDEQPKQVMLFFYNSGYLFSANGKKAGGSVLVSRIATTEEQLLPDGLISETYTDYDGNTYQCTKIGLQVWTTTNLKVTHYVDGTPIPTNLSDAAWTADTDGACAVYGKNDGAFVPTGELDTEDKMAAAYGRLYNWYAVNNAHGLIDTTDGWHVPTDAEFTQLTDYLIATYSDITIYNVGDVLKSVRQVNSPYVITDQVHIKPKLNKRIDASIIDNLPSGNTSTPLIEKTYLELTTLITNSELISGQKYLISDYQTVHKIPNVSNVHISVGTSLEIGVEYIVTYLGNGDDFSNVGYISTNIPFIATNTTPNVWTNYSNLYEVAQPFIGEIEPLIVTANSTYSLISESYSTIHQQDIIYYDINNNQDAIPGCTKGYIYRRIDTKQNNDFPFDFRNVVFRRWQINVTNIWVSGNTYSKGSVVLKENTTEIYISLFDNNTTQLNDGDYRWIKFEHSNLSYILYLPGGQGLSGVYLPSSNEYRDYNIISDWSYYVNNVYNNIIRSKSIGNLNILNRYNTVILNYGHGIYFNNNKINGSFYDNTILSSFQNNTIDDMFGENLICNYFDNNNIGWGFNRIYTNNFIHNNIKGLFANCILDTIEYSNIDDSFQYNYIYRISHSIIEGAFQNNSITLFTENVIGWGFQNNSIDISFNRNHIGDNCCYNIFGKQFDDNTIGNNCRNNTILDTFQGNVIHNSFQNNTIGNVFTNNNCKYDFSNNIISNYMGNNIIGDYFSNNHIGDYFTKNVLQYNCGGLTTDNRGFNKNKFDDNIYGVDFSNYLHVNDDNYEKNIKKNSNGTIFLSYIDSYDDTIILNQSELIVIE